MNDELVEEVQELDEGPLEELEPHPQLLRRRPADPERLRDQLQTRGVVEPRVERQARRVAEPAEQPTGAAAAATGQVGPDEAPERRREREVDVGGRVEPPVEQAPVPPGAP